MKKLGSLLLALILLISTAVTAFAGNPLPRDAKIVGVAQPINRNNDPNLDNLKISELGSDRSVYFPLTADMFDWDSVDNVYPDPVTRNHVSHSRLTVHTSSRTGAASSLIESVNIAYKSSNASGNRNTANVQVKFRADAATSGKRSFGITLYLSLSGEREDSSEFTLSGSLAEDTNSDIQSGDYVDISDGTTLKPDHAARNVELYLGAGVTMKTSLTARQKHYGIAGSEISDADDSLIRKFSSIEDIIVIRQSGLNKSGNYVHIDTGSNFYVYNDKLQYIGRSNSTLPFSSKYYLSSENINMGGSSVAEAQSLRNSSDDHITRESALAQTKLALGSDKAAVVRYKNEDCILISTLQEMNAAAKKAGGTVSLVADTTDDSNKIQGRLTIPAASAVGPGSTEIELGVYTDSSHTSPAKAGFEKWYDNKVAVVSLAQNGSYGMSVNVAAKVDLKSIKASTLYLYSYDKSTKKLQQINGANASVDKNGFLHFTTTLGDEIIITGSPLKRK